jgi:hypothetical protein
VGTIGQPLERVSTVSNYGRKRVRRLNAHFSKPHKRKRLRSLTKGLPRRPARAKLERACRIALMEAEHPASVEAIYDRIVRRGSLQFSGYKRPLKVIASAMSSLVKRKEAVLFLQGNARSRTSWPQRLWRRAAPDDVSPSS